LQSQKLVFNVNEIWKGGRNIYEYAVEKNG
jgi:hypothetical protein